MKNIQYDNSDESNSDFDSGPEEPNLCTLSGYDCCEDCHLRLSTLERITHGVKQIQQEGL